MHHVIYSPFPDGSFKTDIEVYARQKRLRTDGKAKQYHVKVHDPATPLTLASFGMDIRLYVMGHGDKGDNGQMVGDELHKHQPPTSYGGNDKRRYFSKQFQFSKGGFFRYSLTPYELVEILQWDGLQKGAREVRLFACEAAKDSDCFAYKFADAMADPEAYPGTKVFGYKGKLSFGTGTKRADVEGTLNLESAKRQMVEVTKSSMPKSSIGEFDDLLAELNGLMGSFGKPAVS
jgi:hypothetical protein